jgi:hypothetical protein
MIAGPFIAILVWRPFKIALAKWNHGNRANELVLPPFILIISTGKKPELLTAFRRITG